MSKIIDGEAVRGADKDQMNRPVAEAAGREPKAPNTKPVGHAAEEPPNGGRSTGAKLVAQGIAASPVTVMSIAGMVKRFCDRTSLPVPLGAIELVEHQIADGDPTCRMLGRWVQNTRMAASLGSVLDAGGKPHGE